MPIHSLKTNVTFEDIYGMEDTKLIMKEIIEILTGKSDKYKNIGAKLRKGVLLYGPSGTGKTLLAKAVAGEAGVNFLYKSASEFNLKYVGQGAESIRELFKYAQKS